MIQLLRHILLVLCLAAAMWLVGTKPTANEVFLLSLCIVGWARRIGGTDAH